MPIKIHLSRLMGERRIRAAELARKTGINKNTISALYNEKVSGIKFETLEKLCEFFGCNVNEIIEFIQKK